MRTLCFALAIALVTPSAFARELQGRVGLGYNSEFEGSNADGGVPGISLKYHFNRDLGVEGIFATTTASPRSGVSGIKLIKNVFLETNLNFYGFLGGAIVAVKDVSGAQFLSGFGVEFFIPGLESLGLSMETGGTIENVTTGSMILKTMGVSFVNAGMHFYF